MENERGGFSVNHLPSEYLEQMEKLLGTEYTDFIRTYRETPARGLRINTLKVPAAEGAALLPFHLEPIPWCETGFFYDHHRDRPGKHVYHAAGLYYIQDPSAMAPVEALAPLPGEKVLDLCAAPGGKSTQIAAKLQGRGLLVSNEISPQRRKALVENLERCGVPNAVVLGEDPHYIKERFAGFFDRILIDAPCSGEGMFRKDPESCERWSPKATVQCADLQLEILDAAAPMLRPGGILTYSTCTFNPSENEGVLSRFLKQYPEFEVQTVPGAEHYQPARPEWADAPSHLSKAARLWPHHLRGEGHFVAVLKKIGGPEGTKQRTGKLPPVHNQAVQAYRAFVKETLTTPPDHEQWTLFGNHLYRMLDELPPVKGIKVERPGFYLGQLKGKHFIPSHAWALALSSKEVQRSINFEVEDPDLYRYLQGEAIPVNLAKGWTLVTVNGFSLGWGKVSGGLLKNHYPKWLRWDENFFR
jgi:NOL1/NOP2/sun family putative RNA methylase